MAEVHALDGYPIQWPVDPRSWLAPDNLLAAWVLEHEHALVGHVALRSAVGEPTAAMWSAASGLPAERIASVVKLFVAPSSRGYGFGAALLAKACDEARARGLQPALEVLAHDSAAIALYERAGWRRVASSTASWTLPGGELALLHSYLAPD